MNSTPRLMEGYVAIVTGGVRGIGRAIAETFARHGSKVFVNFASADDAAESLVSFAKSEGLDIVALKGSVTDRDHIKHLIAEAKNRYGKIDVLVNNAGIVRDGLLMMMSDATWDSVLETNLRGTFMCCREVIKSMIGQRSGRIVNMSSVAGVTGQAGQTNYAASKGGIIGLTKALAREVARFGIGVNAIAPGFIATDMIKSVPDETMKEYIGAIPFQRVGEPSDVADAAVFLASKMSNFITGHVLHVDGGQSM